MVAGGRRRASAGSQPGDHVVFGFIPSCGRCPRCSTGHQNLCDLGAAPRPRPPDLRRHVPPPRANGQDLGLMCLLGTFSAAHRRQRGELHQDRPGHPARPGLPARLRRGDRLGLGGLRRRGRVRATWSPSSASAASAPTPCRAPASPAPSRSGRSTRSSSSARRPRSSAPPTPPPSLEEARPAIAEVTWGRMADKVIMTMGVGDGSLLAAALAITAKRGRVVVTNIHPAMETRANISLLDLTLNVLHPARRRWSRRRPGRRTRPPGAVPALARLAPGDREARRHRPHQRRALRLRRHPADHVGLHQDDGRAGADPRDGRCGPVGQLHRPPPRGALPGALPRPRQPGGPRVHPRPAGHHQGQRRERRRRRQAARRPRLPRAHDVVPGGRHADGGAHRVRGPRARSTASATR